MFEIGDQDTTVFSLDNNFSCRILADNAIAISGVIAGYPKLFIREPTTRLQPSTRTKRRSLKGIDIMTGGSIIIPIDIKIDATIMSITRKGILRF